jgi:type 1 glutamine amidotransferase/sugar phosphate isomerase/epimerase
VRLNQATSVGVIAAIFAIAAGIPSSTQTGRGFTGPSRSVRPSDQALPRASAATLLGWRIGARADTFAPLTFLEAAEEIDAAGLAFIEGVSTQPVSPDIPKVLDDRLTDADVARVKSALNELRLRMPAYRITTLPPDANARRRLLEFARVMGADLVICPAAPAELADLDRLANEIGVDIAIESRDLAPLAAAMRGLSQRIGVSADLGAWLEAGVKPRDGLPALGDRLLSASVRDRSRLGRQGADVIPGSGVADLPSFLLELSRRQPPDRPADYPPPPGTDGNGKRAAVKNVFLTLDAGRSADVVPGLTRAASAYDAAVRGAIGWRVDALARLTPISTPERVPPAQQQRIDAAIPRQGLVAPKKTRTLLVMDLVLNGAFYHGSSPLANLSLQLMSKNTGAFTPVFSNDLDNLKYPRITRYDGVFLNNIQGDVFADRDALDGLLRYVREGGGVAGLHASTWASPNVPDFGELMGATSGDHKYNGEPGSLRVDDPDSPLTRQFDARGFDFVDEFYHFIPKGPYSREKLHVLLSLDPAKKALSGNQYTNRPDNDYGMVWIRSLGKGRVFNCALGHRPEFYETPAMQQLLLAGTQFILGDLAADTTPSARIGKDR